MHQLISGIVTLFLLVLASPATAGLGEAGELEHARANARAGGPLNERDAELLERHGCLSGTVNDFCKKLSHQRWRDTDQPRKRKRQNP